MVTLRCCDEKGLKQDSAIDPQSLHVLVVDDDPIAAEHARAVLDEVHQAFVPGRSCELRDVCIDSAGVLLGAAFLLLILHWIQRKKLKK